MKIGFYDSGLGGLTVLKSVAKELPEYDYYYYGDTAALPYGDKTEEEIYKLASDAMEHLFQQDCPLVVIACNSASADTARKLQQEYLPLRYPDRKVLGVIIPTIEELIETESESALLLATKRTVESNKYQRELYKLSHDINLLQIAEPDLVSLIEKGNLIAAEELAAKIIEAAARGREVVILGCTHYSLLKDGLRKRFADVKIISQDEVIPVKLKKYLESHTDLENKLTKGGGRQIHLTEHRPDYDKTLELLIGGVMVSEE